jgi:hypothetical protein
MSFKEQYATPNRHFDLDLNNSKNFYSYIKNANISDEQIKPIKDKITPSNDSDLADILVRNRKLSPDEYNKIDEMDLKNGAKWAGSDVATHLLKTANDNPAHPRSITINRGLAGNKYIKGENLDKLIENPKLSPRNCMGECPSRTPSYSEID